MRNDQIRRLVLAGVLAAIIIVLTALVSLPLPGGHGYINLGDAGVLTAAFVLGGPWGALCGGVASAASDLLLGWGVYAPATFVIKGGMAFLAACLMQRKGRAARLWVLYPAALVVPAGYFLFEAILYGAAVALPNMPLNLVQCLVGAGAAHAVNAVLGKKGPAFSAQAGELYSAAPDAGALEEPQIVREPKGGPDVVLIGCEEELETLLKAGDHLSVRGFTARIVKLPRATPLEALLPAQRAGIIPEGVAYVCISECGRLQKANAPDIAKAAMEAMRI